MKIKVKVTLFFKAFWDLSVPFFYTHKSSSLEQKYLGALRYSRANIKKMSLYLKLPNLEDSLLLTVGLWLTLELHNLCLIWRKVIWDWLEQLCEDLLHCYLAPGSGIWYNLYLYRCENVTAPHPPRQDKSVTNSSLGCSISVQHTLSWLTRHSVNIDITDSPHVKIRKEFTWCEDKHKHLNKMMSWKALNFSPRN